MRTPDETVRHYSRLYDDMLKWPELPRITRELAGKRRPVRQAERKHIQTMIARKFRRDAVRDAVSDAEVSLVATYYNGDFDHKPGHGRPIDPWHWIVTGKEEFIIRQVQREQQCTSLTQAIELAAPQLGLDRQSRRRLWKKLTGQNRAARRQQQNKAPA